MTVENNNPPESENVHGGRVAAAFAMAVFLPLGIATSLTAMILVVNAEIGASGIPGAHSFFWILVCLLLARGTLYLRVSGENPGQVITDQDQPELFSMIRQVAERLNARMPDRVYLVPDANLGVRVRCPVPFLFRGRDLLVGMTLLNRLSVGSVRACLLNVMTALMRDRTWPQRWLAAAQGCLDRVVTESNHSMFTILFELYAKSFLVLIRPINKSECKKADRVACREAGKELVYKALVQVAWVSNQLMEFLQNEILTLLTAGGLPDNLYQGLRIWLEEHDPCELESLAPEKLLEKLPMSLLGRMRIVERLAAVRSMPEGPEWDDPCPARSLLKNPEDLERATSPYVVGMLLRHGLQRINRDPIEVPWEDVESRLIIPQQKARARHVLETIGALVQRKVEHQEGINIYLSLIDVPELRDRLAGHLDPSLARLPPALYPNLVLGVLIRFLGTLVGSALVEVGKYRWVKSIAQPLEVQGDEGERLDPFSLARDLLEGELDVGKFRMTLFRHGLFLAK